MKRRRACAFIPLRKFFKNQGARLALSLCLTASLIGSACFQSEPLDAHYGRVIVPRAQEFRWSDGGLPQVFDPALAAAPPDTDAVRAMFEGLTDYDPQTLAPVPGVAERWESSTDGREWTFYLRPDARWNNGAPVTAQDFVRSWQRTLALGERAPHARLLENIEGAFAPPLVTKVMPAEDTSRQTTATDQAKETRREEKRLPKTETQKTEMQKPLPLGVEAVNDYVLRVRLQRADVNFPSLVAHPVFRPVYVESNSVAMDLTARPPAIVSNGAFQLSKTAEDAVVLERAKNYWDAQTVSLQRVQFVATQTAEASLAAYRAGDVDAVTNAGFEPLALKLLTPYKDFRRATFGALTFYSFNLSRAPFNDARVRSALAISIDRERITEDEMDGATEPATKFLPVQIANASNAADDEAAASFERDAARARSLLAAAGYPQGNGFPKIRLLINRNDHQRAIAQAVAAMWWSTLGVETDVIIKSWEDYEESVRTGDYDVVRRGVVMQTTDASTNLRAIFEAGADSSTLRADEAETTAATSTAAEATEAGRNAAQQHSETTSPAAKTPPATVQFSTEQEAIKEVPAIPLYFASSYSLVKPYVTGFDPNLLDAYSLKRVSIDTAWRPPAQESAVWFKKNE